MAEPDTFGQLLRRYRLAASLSQETLGERAGLSANAIAALERGRRRSPRPATVLMLAQGLGLNPEQRALFISALGSTPPIPASDTRARVPVTLTSFVGRATELQDVRQLLGSVRLLTLVGPAGVGKTRLALEAARAASEEVVFVQLASVSDETQVPYTVAAAVGVQEAPQQPLVETLARALQSRHLLLVLDNCEHLLGGCASLARTLLQACPGVVLLTTSREPLRIAGEVVWPVPVLSLPELETLSAAVQLSGSEAVSLFVERAREVRPSFELNEQNVRAVANLCVQLDGLPLALELAAARARLLEPAQIADRLNDRFRLLASASRGAPTRHQSLQAAIDWSFDLLSEPERLLLERLAIFAGGWTLEAAEAVCAGGGIAQSDVLSLLGRLVDRSLVVVEPGTGGAFRYRLLETIREYATDCLEKSDETDDLAQRHRTWYLRLAEQALQAYWLRDDLTGWWARLAPEQANFRAAMRYSLNRCDPEPGLRLATGIWVLWGFRGPWLEGADWIARFLGLPGAIDPAVRADGLTVAGQLLFEQGDVAAAHDVLLEAVALQRQIGADRGLAMALDHAGLVASARGEFEAAQAFHAEAVRVDQATGNPSYEAISLEAWAAGTYLQGDYDLARSLAERSRALVDSLDHSDGSLKVDANITTYILGRIALCSGDTASARRQFEANLVQWRATGDARSRPAVGALVGLSCVDVMDGDLTRARNLLAEARVLSERLGSGAVLAYTLEGYAILAVAAHRPAHAFRLAGAASALRASLHHPISPAEREVLERWLASARSVLGDEAAQEEWKAGQAFSTAQAIHCARTLEHED